MSPAVMTPMPAISAQANPTKPVLRAEPGRSQNRQLMRGAKL
jgi:hypothetical protein